MTVQGGEAFFWFGFVSLHVYFAFVANVRLV